MSTSAYEATIKRNFYGQLFKYFILIKKQECD